MTRRLFYPLVAVGVLINLSGLFSPILEPDGALYASIAKQMARTSDWVNLYAVGNDWLDKPHFPFWITALSFRLFGPTSIAYKLPALLFFFGGVVYTYYFTRLFYRELTAQIAALVVLTAFHGVLSNADVRAEPYLLGLIIGAVYHFARLYQQNRPLDLVLGALLTGCALMTKGLFVGVPIGAGLVFHWLITGDWRQLLRPRWYVAVVLAFVCTLPELYTLYLQFDSHPEKVVFGQTGVSGIRFFLWDSQFGRFFNTGPIKGAGEPTFFLHTTLWAFLPWSLLLYAAVGRIVVALVKQRRSAIVPEYISLGSALATFALFSLSGFQLPHYINIVFPFFAVLTANFLTALTSAGLRWWTTVQTAIGAIVLILLGAILYFFRPDYTSWGWAWLVLTAVGTLILFRGTTLTVLVGRSIGTMAALFGIWNILFYPSLMQYQAGMKAAEWVNATQPLTRPTGIYGKRAWSYEFYVNRPVEYMEYGPALKARVAQTPMLLLTSAERADSLSRTGLVVRPLAHFTYFHVSLLTANFLNYATRSKTLEPWVVAEVKVR